MSYSLLLSQSASLRNHDGNIDIHMQSILAVWLKSVNPVQFMSWFADFTQVAYNLIDTWVL